jgi:hypothetical protein
VGFLTENCCGGASCESTLSFKVGLTTSGI